MIEPGVESSSVDVAHATMMSDPVRLRL
jgi:hypothetical protein